MERDTRSHSYGPRRDINRGMPPVSIRCTWTVWAAPSPGNEGPGATYKMGPTYKTVWEIKPIK
jgi:hypothetical protein